MRVVLFVVGVLLAVAVEAAPDDAALMERGRGLTAAYLAGDVAAIWTQMAPAMQRFTRGEAQFA
jgi:hypothetical protein